MRLGGIGVLFVAAVLALAPVRGQDRAPLAGWVLDRAGERVAGAEVLLVHRVLPFALDAEGLNLPGDDVLRARTGSDGRFRVEAFEGRGYSGFAWWTDEGGRQHATLQQEDLVVGGFAEFEEPSMDYGPMPLTVAVEGLEAWAELGPFAFRVVPFLGHPLALPVLRTRSGEIVAPPLPANRGYFEVVTSDGELLHAARVQGRASSGADGGGSVVVAVPPPQRRSLRVVQAGDGLPIAGATVRMRASGLSYRIRSSGFDQSRIRGAWRTLGETGAGGEITCCFPGASGQPMFASLEVSAPGRAAVHAGWLEGRPFVSGAWTDASNEDLLVVPLPAADPIRGTVSAGPGQVLSGAVVYLQTEVAVDPAEIGSHWVVPGLLTTTDHEGRFGFPAASRGYGKTTAFVVPPRSAQSGAAGLAVSSESESNDSPRNERVWPEWVVPLPRSVDAGQRRRLGVLEFGELQEIRVEVVDAGGRPIRGARVATVAGMDGSARVHPDVWTDGRGRAGLVVTADRRHRLLVSHPLHGFRAWTPRDVDSRVQLEPFVEICGVAVNPERRPAAHASVHLRQTRAATGAPELVGEERRVDQLLQYLNQFRSARAKADGSFVLRVYPVRGFESVLQVYGVGCSGSVVVDVAPGDGRELVGDPTRRVDLGDLLLGSR